MAVFCPWAPLPLCWGRQWLLPLFGEKAESQPSQKQQQKDELAKKNVKICLLGEKALLLHSYFSSLYHEPYLAICGRSIWLFRVMTNFTPNDQV